MPGFIGGSTGGTGTGGEITFPKEFIDPVTKLRVSQPSNLIDTDFEYGLQPTKWETVELINNTPSFFSKSGDTTIPDIISITTNAGTREIIVTTADLHGLAVGIPINVTGTKSVTADGSYIINSIPNTTTFTYLCKDIQPTTASIEDLYSSIITGEFFQGSQIRIADSEGITTDGAAVSTLTVRTPSPHGFGVNTPFYLLNLNSTVSQEFAAANTETKSFDASNSATAQTFDGSNTLSTINIDWSNSAVSGGVTSSISTSNATADTITVNHGTENFLGKPVGTPFYYNVVSSSGYFADNPRGVVFLKTVDSLGTTSSTFQVSETPDGNAIDIVASMTGTFQLANQARTFAGNNINALTQEEVTVIYDAVQEFDATNTAGQVLTVDTYSGGGLVTATDLVGETGLPWYAGTMVLYTTDGTAATGLVNNTTYFIDSTFQQGTSNVYSFTLKNLPGASGTPVSSISGGTGTETFKKIGISIDKNIFHIQNNGLLEKDMVRYEFPEGARFGVVSVDEEKNFYFVSQVYDAHNFTLNQSAGDLSPSTIDFTNIDRGSTITSTVTPIGLTSPITYAVTSETLPSGLALNTSTGIVSGTVVEVINAPGRDVVITATDADGTTAIQTHTYQINATAASITPATIDRTTLVVGTAMAATTATTTNLVAPITWAVSSGTLPTGISLNTSTGVVSGTPTEEIASPGRQVTIRATDVGGLQAFQVHTYQVAAPPVVAGQANFTSPGTFNWTAPYTTTVSILCVGGGGGGGASGGGNGPGGSGGGGGALAYKNDVSVTAGTTYTVVVGGGGAINVAGGNSSVTVSGQTYTAFGGARGITGSTSITAGGTRSANTDGGGNGGTGNRGGPDNGDDGTPGAGGGAGGYSGNGGNGGRALSGSGGTAGTAGAGGGGGGGGGGNGSQEYSAGGGGVGIYGQGANGAGGAATSSQAPNPGQGGSGGGNGGANPGNGGGFGGGGGGGGGTGGGPGAGGAVRIVWPSTTVGSVLARRWPTTRVNTDL